MHHNYYNFNRVFFLLPEYATARIVYLTAMHTVCNAMCTYVPWHWLLPGKLIQLYPEPQGLAAHSFMSKKKY